jgi:signal transduction histidine kinase
MQTLLSQFADGNGFMPHGMCYLWKPELLWLHVLSDTVVALSYFAIPPTLLYLVVRARRELRGDGSLGFKGLPYDWVFVAFGIFIVACGATHVFAVVTVWTPLYWISGSAKAVTAVASLLTAVALPPLVPRALDLIRAARDNERDRRELVRAHLELNELNAHLRDLDRLKSQQFANVSHELRTPLALVVGPADSLLANPALTADQRRHAETIRRNALQLLAHVDDLLDTARSEGGSLRLEAAETDVAHLVREAVGSFDGLSDRRGMQVTLDLPERRAAVVDAPKLERVVLNLVSNAFKFAGTAGSIRVSLGSEELDGTPWMAITVEDDGPGVPEGARTRIFERFFQVDGGSTRRFGGTGLGLAIVRDFAEIHGGAVSVDESPLGGARFTVLIPERGPAAITGAGAGKSDAGPGRRDPGPEAARRSENGHRLPAVAPTEAPGSRGWPAEDPHPRVLVVEDNADMRTFLLEILGQDFACAGAAGGEEALCLVADGLPDLVVTDLMMPGMSGEELVDRLRGLPGGAEVPVLVLTARADPALPARLLTDGVQDFHAKPVRADELVARARNLVNASNAKAVLRNALGEQGGDLPTLSAEIARRKRQLEDVVREKETLLQELHHRVKGNLQTVASLMSLQLRSVEEPSARDALEDSRSRIRAIALLHERLYRAGNIVEVEMGAYLRGLASDLKRAFIGRARPVELRVRTSEVRLDVERAVACGLVAHELVANALEHGAGGVENAIELSLDLWGGDVVLTVEDRGPGLREDRPIGKGLGLDLVRALARQLRGTVHFENTTGLRCQLRFRQVPADREAYVR